MNVEIEHAENPTNLSYSTNKVNFAIYPVGVEYICDGKPVKCAITFISDDLVHDNQQVHLFEKRVF